MSLSPTAVDAFGYPAPVWAHFRSPRRAGRFAPGTAGVIVGQAGTPAARSVLRIELQLAAGVVTDARFRAYGCPTSIAVGAWIAEQAIGHGPSDLRCLDAATIRAALEITDDRAHCALLGEDALRAALATAGDPR